MTVQENITLLSDALANEKDIQFAYLFGSRATGHEKPNSDFDIAIYPINSLSSKMETLTYLSQIEIRLENILKTDKIDLINLRDATPLLRFKIIKNGVLIFEKSKNERVNLVTKWLSEYFDIKPFLDYRNKIVCNELKKI